MKLSHVILAKIMRHFTLFFVGLTGECMNCNLLHLTDKSNLGTAVLFCLFPGLLMVDNLHT
jgi:hypothetical protein